MLTRREKLLVRPWQQRRFNNHQRKVHCALPAIDTTPPPSRNHVSYKLKKLQWEDERMAQIEEDNFRLLQRMGTIMKTKRLDNEWISKPHNFVSRIGIYYEPEPDNSRIVKTWPQFEPRPEVGLTRKQRCQACNPKHDYTAQTIPEERIPWEGAPKKTTPLHDVTRVPWDPSRPEVTSHHHEAPRAMTSRARARRLTVKLPSPQTGHHGCVLPPSRPTTSAHQPTRRDKELKDFLEYNFKNS